MKIGLASDHAGYQRKQTLIDSLTDSTYTVIDYGCHSIESVDYPDYAKLLCAGLISGEIELGVLVCGSGIGMDIAANKYHPQIRAALCHNKEIAALSREHNHANVLCIGANFVDDQLAVEMLTVWLHAAPSTDTRHTHRVAMLGEMCS
jgi:RpiB/LacA/LacB family sugar-phosphate isomerase